MFGHYIISFCMLTSFKGITKNKSYNAHKKKNADKVVKRKQLTIFYLEC